MNKIKVGVVGFGRLGSIHARVYSEFDNVELVGISDINLQKLATAKATYNIKTFSNYLEFLGKVDAVSIATPTSQHYQIAKDLINGGINVLVEKPITNKLSQAKELINLARTKRVILQVGHVERFNSAYRSIENIVTNPRFIECHRLSPFPHRSLDIGVVLDIMIHDIDIILGLVKSEVKKIDAIGVPVLTAFEDIANVRLTFKNGCVCNLTASRVSDEAMRKIRIFLNDTYISLDYLNQQALLYKKEGQNIIKLPLPIEKEEPLKEEIKSFIECIKNKTPPLVSGEEAYKALSLCQGILNKIWNKKHLFNLQQRQITISSIPSNTLAKISTNNSSKKNKKIFISVGEASGDMHASQLVKYIKNKNPNIEFAGLGGKLMNEQGVKIFFDPTSFAVVGFIEVLKNILFFRKIFFNFIKLAEQEKPDLIILVDYPGFNLRLAKELKRRGFKIAYYISPQIWAWGKNRIKTIRESVDKMIVFFDFEEELYKKNGIKVEFVGHPLIEQTTPSLTKEIFFKTYDLSNDSLVICLLPGSRNSVVEKILPILLKSCEHIHKEIPQAQFFILISPTVNVAIYHHYIKKSNLPIKLIEDPNYNVLAYSDLGLLASGTATLEAAILNLPMVIVYKISFLSWLFAKFLVKIPYIGLVNVIAKKQIVPEFIQFQARPELIAKEAINIIKNKNRYRAIKEELSKIKTHLGLPGASRRAAESIIALIEGNC